MNSYKGLTLIFLAVVMTGCASANANKKDKASETTTLKKDKKEKKADKVLTMEERLLMVEKKASKQGRKILKTGREMTLDNGEIIKGGCWDYANEVYNRAGFSNSSKKRRTVFKGKEKKGPYADVKLINAGDFLYYVNHSYNDIEHSAIFIEWIDYKEKIALMLSYAGERRQEPARYLSYDLSHVYRIIRAVN